MKKSNIRFSYTLIFLFFFSLFTNAQNTDIEKDGPGYGENCTTIMVGKLASSDGSVMTSHSCDGNYRTWLEIFPHQKYDQGKKHPVYSGMLHTEEAWDMTKVSLKGDLRISEHCVSLSK
jgi:dipeptidase